MWVCPLYMLMYMYTSLCICTCTCTVCVCIYIYIYIHGHGNRPPRPLHVCAHRLLARCFCIFVATLSISSPAEKQWCRGDCWLLPSVEQHLASMCPQAEAPYSELGWTEFTLSMCSGLAADASITYWRSMSKAPAPQLLLQFDAGTCRGTATAIPHDRVLSEMSMWNPTPAPKAGPTFRLQPCSAHLRTKRLPTNLRTAKPASFTAKEGVRGRKFAQTCINSQALATEMWQFPC